MLTICPTLSNVKNLSRTLPGPDGIRLIMSASGLEFHFRGRELSFLLKGDEAVKGSNEDNHARFRIFAGGEVLTEGMLSAPEQTVTVYAPGSGEHDVIIRFLKLSEAPMSSILISAILTDENAEITPTPCRERHIEIIGDSITCGYAIDDEDPLHDFKTSTEDASKAYAYLVAQGLNADYNIVSYSGYGIVSGYTGTGEINRSELLPPYYETMGRCYGFPEAEKLPWDFQRFTPELVIINLGTNDDSYCLEYEDRRSDHRALYKEFLKTVRSHYPEARILCILGIMGDRLYPNVELAVNQYRDETGDRNISALHMDEQLPEDGLVANYHPTERTHRKAADVLLNYLGKLGY